MTKKDIDNIISIICPNDEDFEKQIISPAYLEKELEALALEQEPCEDMVSRGVFEQVMGERDIAISQLKELGYEFGEKIEPCEDVADALAGYLPIVTLQPKTGHWILSDDGLCRPICDKCGAHPWKGYIPTVEEATAVFKYCPSCGAKMIEQEKKIDGDILKGFEKFTRMMFRQGQAESEGV